MKTWVASVFEKQDFLRLDYFEIAEEDTLQVIYEKQKNTKYRAFIAVYAGEVRLIDNIALRGF